MLDNKQDETVSQRPLTATDSGWGMQCQDCKPHGDTGKSDTENINDTETRPWTILPYAQAVSLRGQDPNELDRIKAKYITKNGDSTRSPDRTTKPGPHRTDSDSDSEDCDDDAREHEH